MPLQTQPSHTCVCGLMIQSLSVACEAAVGRMPRRPRAAAIRDVCSSAFAGSRLRDRILAGLADVSPVGLHALLDAMASRLHLGTVGLEVGTADINNDSRLRGRNLTVFREVVEVFGDTSLDAPFARLHIRALRLDVGRAGF